MLGAAAVQQAQDIFHRHDRDASNDIDTRELREALQELGLKAPSAQQTSSILRRFDADGNGRIDMAEFLRLVQSLVQFKAYASGDTIGMLFTRYDIDGSGHIDMAELRVALSHLGLVVNAQQAKAILSKYANASGMLDLNGFHTLVDDLRRFKAAGSAVPPGADVEDSVAQSFRHADANRSGDLDLMELHAVLKSLGLAVDGPADTHQVMRRYDADGSGGLQLGEYRKMIFELRDFKGRSMVR